MMHNLLDISLAPGVLAFLHNIPIKYNIIIHLWTHRFHKLLESPPQDSLYPSCLLNVFLYPSSYFPLPSQYSYLPVLVTLKFLFGYYELSMYLYEF